MACRPIFGMDMNDSPSVFAPVGRTVRHSLMAKSRTKSQTRDKQSFSLTAKPSLNRPKHSMQTKVKPRYMNFGSSKVSSVRPETEVKFPLAPVLSSTTKNEQLLHNVHSASEDLTTIIRGKFNFEDNSITEMETKLNEMEECIHPSMETFKRAASEGKSEAFELYNTALKFETQFRLKREAFISYRTFFENVYNDYRNFLSDECKLMEDFVQNARELTTKYEALGEMKENLHPSGRKPEMVDKAIQAIPEPVFQESSDNDGGIMSKIGLPGTPKLRTQKEEHFKEPRHDEHPVIPTSSFLQDLTQTRDNSYSSIKYATKHFTKHSSPFSKPLNFDETMANLKIEDSSSFIDKSSAPVNVTYLKSEKTTFKNSTTQLPKSPVLRSKKS